MQTKSLSMMGGLLVGLAILQVLSGCEGTSNPDTAGVDSYFANNPITTNQANSTPSSSDMAVAPASVVGSYVGQMFTFTATGGQAPYHWSVSTASGEIRSINSDGSQGLYNVATVGANTVVAWDANGNSATAQVNTGGGGVLVISPSSITLTNNGQVATFSVSGGTPPYIWSTLNPKGALNTTGGGSVIYTRTAAGDNGVTVNDTVGDSASAGISQP